MVWINANLAPGTKRHFEVAFANESVQMASNSLMEVDRWIPFSRYQLQEITRGVDPQTMRANFTRIVDECRSDCRFIRGEWCTPEFAGLERRQGAVNQQLTRTSRHIRL